MTPVQTLGTDPNVDNSVWTTALSRIGGLFTSLTNEFMQCIQCIGKATTSTGSYEKCGLQIQALQQDPSDYTNHITRDLVAGSRVAEISGNNPTGRAWGGYDEGGDAAGSDGLMLARETGGNNHGSAQPNLDTPTSKVLDSFVAGEYDGNQPMTAITHASGGTSQFFHGHIVERSAIVNDAEAFGIRDQGQIIAGLQADGTLQLRFFNQPTEPNLQPGTVAIWGNTSTGVTYLVFNNGGGILKTVLS